MKFKVGSKVIVKQVYSGGNFAVGDIVEICQMGDDDGHMTCYGAISPYDGIKWYLNEDEVEAVSGGDRIRSMTDEELAEYIAKEKLNVTFIFLELNNTIISNERKKEYIEIVKQRILKKLKQPMDNS